MAYRNGSCNALDPYKLHDEQVRRIDDVDYVGASDGEQILVLVVQART